jgi:transposase
VSDEQYPDSKAERFAEVLRLSLLEGMSARAIGRKLGMSRNTVRWMLGRVPHAKRQATVQSRTSLLDPYKQVLKQLLEEIPDIKAPAALERLRRLGYQGGISVLRERLRVLRPRPRAEAFLTLDFLPGCAMQVDWADFGFSIPGCPRRVSCLVMALCYSRYLYLEFCLSQQFGTFVRTLDRGLRFFGGSTAIEIFDNMRTVVTTYSGGLPVFNRRLLDYAASRGFALTACRPHRPQQKGRVERPVGFIRERFWPGRRFISLLDLNRQARAWLDDFANHRTHEQTGKVPALVFEHEERRLLKPLPEQPFDTDDVTTATVTKLFRVRFDRNTYSVPPRLVSQTVLVRANDDQVSVYLGPRQVALHQRCWGAGEDIEHPSHRQRALEKKPTGAVLPPGLAGTGDVGREYFKTLAASRRSISREILRLVFLCEVFGQSQTSSAMQEVMQTGHIGSEYVEYVLLHKRGLVPQATPLKLGKPELDSLAFKEPDLSVYDQLGNPEKTLDPGPLPANIEPEDTHEDP